MTGSGFPRTGFFLLKTMEGRITILQENSKSFYEKGCLETVF
ncbi:hypothetical protein LEP1GSC195_0194 [Leptospira wolbachii serovar Codice str. CDC]|uniref:Uncharacterized protein n=1 Tax=Leptospira wolbachii serovar Codice str. CDC TaxID=1218599 RepID=R9A6X1_9LEPT|nr:hypothetical protein LEP1GSC195_0194 [Leptospira wolbachii serovar Codice str. CDC]